jgi:hypothetical protein
MGNSPTIIVNACSMLCFRLHWYHALGLKGPCLGLSFRVVTGHQEQGVAPTLPACRGHGRAPAGGGATGHGPGRAPSRRRRRWPRAWPRPQQEAAPMATALSPGCARAQGLPLAEPLAAPLDAHQVAPHGAPPACWPLAAQAPPA